MKWANKRRKELRDRTEIPDYDYGYLEDWLMEWVNLASQVRVKFIIEGKSVVVNIFRVRVGIPF